MIRSTIRPYARPVYRRCNKLFIEQVRPPSHATLMYPLTSIDELADRRICAPARGKLCGGNLNSGDDCDH